MDRGTNAVKILIIGPSWVGDMVMSQSLYMRLKEIYPESKVDVLAPAWCKAILEKMPEIRKAIEMPLGHGALDIKTRYQLGKSLRSEQYTHAYILPNSAKSALIPFFAKIPNRIGWKGEMRYGLLTDLRPDKKVFQYMVERYVSLAYPKKEMLNGSGSLGDIHKLPRPTLSIDKQQRGLILDKFSLTLNKDIIGLCPGAEFGPAKRWPETHYGEVAKKLTEQGTQVWLFGSVNDREVTTKIKNIVEKKHLVYDLAGKTSLNEAVDLLSCCRTVVSNDSGLMHVAAAVGCHLVAIYGSSSPRYTPPLTAKVSIIQNKLACQPCFKKECPLGHLDCLKKLPVDTVLHKINSTLGNQ